MTVGAWSALSVFAATLAAIGWGVLKFWEGGPRRRQVKREQRVRLVLSALADGPRYGLEMIEATGLNAGILYPILSVLEADGLITGSWTGGPKPRRIYHLNPGGVRRLMHLEQDSGPRPHG